MFLPSEEDIIVTGTVSRRWTLFLVLMLLIISSLVKITIIVFMQNHLIGRKTIKLYYNVNGDGIRRKEKNR